RLRSGRCIHQKRLETLSPCSDPLSRLLASAPVTRVRTHERLSPLAVPLVEPVALVEPMEPAAGAVRHGPAACLGACICLQPGGSGPAVLALHGAPDAAGHGPGLAAGARYSVGAADAQALRFGPGASLAGTFTLAQFSKQPRQRGDGPGGGGLVVRAACRRGCAAAGGGCADQLEPPRTGPALPG